MVHGDLALEPELLQPGLVVDPQIAAAAADERVLLQVRARARNAVASRIIPAAVKRPIVDAELPADKPGRLLKPVLGAAKGDVRLARAEVADRLRRVEIDHDLRVQAMQLG